VRTRNHALPRILVVDDDLRLRDLLRRYLEREGFAVEAVPHANELEATLAANGCDLIVLDITLPGRDGLAVCRALRDAGNLIPIVLLTARGDEVDRIIGLEAGADDYLPKPFNPRELLARIRAVLRRQTTRPPGAPRADMVGEPRILRFGDCELDLAARTLRRGEISVALSTGEFAVLEALACRPGEALSRSRLLKLARGRDYDGMDRSIDIQITRLRKLVEADPATPRYLQTVRGVGYVFVGD
jgi:two-component system, OmpR family, phosphate regulon response regulator OmpR